MIRLGRRAHAARHRLMPAVQRPVIYPFRVEVEKADPAIADPKKLAQMLVSLYLSDEVFADKDKHCPLYALPSDAARAGLKPQKAYTDEIRGMTKVFRDALTRVHRANREAVP